LWVTGADSSACAVQIGAARGDYEERFLLWCGAVLSGTSTASIFRGEESANQATAWLSISSLSYERRQHVPISCTRLHGVTSQETIH
jgi:hypothetical protein